MRKMDLRGITIKITCHNCGKITDLNIEPMGSDTIYKFSLICENCGAFNAVSVNPLTNDSTDTRLSGMPVQGFEWVLPSGKIVPVIGDPIYVSANGEHLSRNAYMDMYKLDPEIAYNYIRKRLDEQTTNKATNKATNSLNSDSISASLLNPANIQKIEILCTNCGHICELSL